MSKKAYIIISEPDYILLNLNGDLTPNNGAEEFTYRYDNEKANKWILNKFTESTGIKTSGLLTTHPGWTKADKIAPYRKAGHFYVCLNLEIPDTEYLETHGNMDFCLLNLCVFTRSEDEWNSHNAYWDAYLNSYDLDHFSYKSNPKIAEGFENSIIETWDHLLDIDCVYDENWCGNARLYYVGRILKDWIVSIESFEGTSWQKWIGSKKLDPSEIPDLCGYGDDLKVGDYFKILGRSEEYKYRLTGWEMKDGYVHVFATREERESYVSFYANPDGGDLVFIKTSK